MNGPVGVVRRVAGCCRVRWHEGPHLGRLVQVRVARGVGQQHAERDGASARNVVTDNGRKGAIEVENPSLDQVQGERGEESLAQARQAEDGPVVDRGCSLDVGEAVGVDPYQFAISDHRCLRPARC